MTGDTMEFPETFDEFADTYGLVDTEEVYTNGSQLIPVFRVKQWLEHINPQPKMGQWVSSAIQGEIHGQIVKAFICSKCDAISVFRVMDGEIVNGDICPNCKADMRGG